MKAVWSRFFDVQGIDATTFKGAQEWLSEQEEAFDIFALGVYVDETKILYVPDNRAEMFGGDEWFSQQIAGLGASCRKKCTVGCSFNCWEELTAQYFGSVFLRFFGALMCAFRHLPKQITSGDNFG